MATNIVNIETLKAKINALAEESKSELEANLITKNIERTQKLQEIEKLSEEIQTFESIQDF